MLVAAALLAVYIVLGMLYESYVHPVTILSTLPSAGIGALVALLLFGVDLDIIAIVGLLLLIGIVKKNAILLIDFAIEAERKEGARPRTPSCEPCSLRFRPILMTTCAALFGALPLAFGRGPRLRAPAPARHHDRRRPARVAAAHALHDPGRVPGARGPAATRVAAGVARRARRAVDRVTERVVREGVRDGEGSRAGKSTYVYVC